MNADTLCARVRVSLERQINWMETVLRDMEGLESGLSEAALERLADLQQRREAQLADLLREHRGMMAEWRAAQGVSPEARETIRRLDDEAVALSKRLRCRYDEAIAWTHGEMKQCSEALRSIRRGRDMVGRYYPGADEPPGFIDRQA